VEELEVEASTRRFCGGVPTSMAKVDQGPSLPSLSPRTDTINDLNQFFILDNKFLFFFFLFFSFLILILIFLGGFFFSLLG
jgi:hypothetical protein